MSHKIEVRLDQILLEQGLITEQQIVEALNHQKKYGGRFGSQLIYLKYINETALVKALSRQIKCAGVLLSKLDIPYEILKFIPKQLAVSRKIIPFAYDPQTNVLKIACENPYDRDLINEINYVTQGKKVKLYLAAELAINTSIAIHYLDRDVTEDFLWELPPLEDLNIFFDENDPLNYSPIDSQVSLHRGVILIVTDDNESLPQLTTILESDGFEIRNTDSAKNAIGMLEDEVYHSVFIKDTVPGDYLDLIDRIRKISPQTNVRYFEDSSSLLLEDGDIRHQETMLIQNLELFTTLLTSKEKMPHNHSGVVGLYVKRLCEKLKLPAKTRSVIINAAYLHDIGRYYYESEDSSNYKKQIENTVKFLTSINYPPIVIEMLKSMYINLKHKYTKRLPVEVLGGNILTLVDLFCENITVNERLTLTKLEALKNKINDLIGDLFLKEIVDPFIKMIQDDIFTYQTKSIGSQVMILSEDQQSSATIELHLKKDGFRTFCVNEFNNFIELYERSKPDFLIILQNDLNDHENSIIYELQSLGVNFALSPTFILTDSNNLTPFGHLLEEGVEDIINYKTNMDLFLMKIKKLHSYIVQRHQEEENLKTTPSHTNGRLMDLNLIDLLQALGPSRRTARITVTPAGDNENQLVLYLNEGKIAYAAYDNQIGAPAVYQGLTWDDGTWLVEPVDNDILPVPNNDLPNEMILMEGCRLQDEQNHSDAAK